jgi:uncharacterized membrane protein YraQ (UPF0718 family)
MDAIVRALSMAFAMGCEILWPLILGFALSGIVQAVVSHIEMSRLLPDDRPRSIAIALGLGAASSSCSYAAVALARSIFRKGANFTAAMAFELRQPLGDLSAVPTVWPAADDQRGKNLAKIHAAPTASAPAIKRPPTMSIQTDAQSMTK